MGSFYRTNPDRAIDTAFRMPLFVIISPFAHDSLHKKNQRDPFRIYCQHQHRFMILVYAPNHADWARVEKTLW